jgi:chitin disaccharide deacetylase
MRIVLNADDFGFSADTVRATIECFESGWLTSASLMPGMPATAEALVFASAHPEFSFGVHLTFVGDGAERSTAPPDEVPALVDSDGRFPPTNTVRLRALARRLPEDQIQREVEAQVRAITDLGVTVSHVDSHRHLHKYGPFRVALARVLPKLGVERVRNVQDVYIRRPLRSPTFWLGARWRRRLMAQFTTTTHFYMATSARDGDWTPLLEQLRTVPPDATLEVGAHPGYEEAWRSSERVALSTFAAAAAEAGHALVPWTEINRASR